MATRLFQIKRVPRALLSAWLLVTGSSIFFGLIGMLYQWSVLSDDLAPLTRLGAFGYFMKSTFPMPEGEPFTYELEHLLIMSIVVCAMTLKWPATKTDILDAQKPGAKKKKTAAKK
eukprot:GEMP01045458.1.p2 GENE.GEMP01045458.1~~GEMP01045458.1.p2  ORF type:complete len:123 (+),score=22.92 GEMP01045458.1:24-371(+)